MFKWCLLFRFILSLFGQGGPIQFNKKPMDIEYIHQASLTYNSMVDLGGKKISLPGHIDQ
jgi:hypothetical protein